MAVIEALERQEQLRGLGRANGWLAAALAALTLLSWWLGVPFAAGPSSLKPQTCIAILLLVGALELAARASLPRRAHALQAVLAGAGGAIAVLALVEHGLGRDLGIDRLLLGDALFVQGDPYPGRMAPGTALLLLVVATALALQDVHSRAVQRVAMAVSTVILVSCFLIFGLHLQRVDIPGGPAPLEPFSPVAALALFALALGTLLVRPERGWLPAMLADDAGGHVARRLLPAAVLLPFALGMLVISGVTRGRYDERSAIVLLVVAVALPLAVLVVWSARSLSLFERARVRSEAQLRQSEARYRRIVETAHEGIWILDADHCTQFANPSLSRMLGHGAEDLVGRDLFSFVDPEDRTSWEALLGSETWSSQPSGDVRLRRPDGEELWSMVSVSAFEGGDGLPEGQLVMLTDVTARRRSELALQQAARIEATATLAAGVAHDVNNMMATVLSNADVVREEVPSGGETREMVDAIREAARRTADLAQQLLAYARGGRYWPRPVDLNSVIERTLEIHRHSWPRSIEVKLDLEPTLPSILADASQMSQIVMNLCTNAVEAMPGRGHLSVATRAVAVREGDGAAASGVSLGPGSWVHLSVEDDGCGMDALTAARVFEPFFSTKFPGRGLGLAAVYGIVQNHGGEIRLDSVPGRGTRLDVWLPASLEAAEREPARERDEVPTGSEAILVVDDEEAVLTATTRLLERLGYHVLRARDGREAVALARRAEVAIDAVILDLDMPVMDGIESFPLLRAARGGVPILLSSGFELDPVSLAARGLVADGLLAKPFGREVIGRMLREALDRRSAPRA